MPAHCNRPRRPRLEPRRALARALPALLGLALHASVAAQASGADSKDDFELGYEAAQQGEFERAARYFERAFERDGDPLALYNLAQARAASGKPVEAVQTLQRLLELPRATEEQRGWARDTLAVQRRRVGSLVARVEPAGADVYVDGRLLPADQRGRPLLLKVGEHTLLAKLGSNESSLRQFTIVGQQSTQLRVVIPEAQAAASPPAVQRDAAVDSAAGPSNSLSWVLGGMGAAMVAGSGALWLLRESAATDHNEELEELGALNPTSDEFISGRRDALDDRDRVAALGLSAVAVGVGGAVALALAWVVYDSGEPASFSARLSPTAPGGGPGLTAVGSF